MANIDVIDSLRNEFNLPLKNGEKRKIIFWNDYEKEFEDVIDEVNIEGVRIHKLTSENSFYSKYLIEEEDVESNFLIYNTVKIQDNKENWLLDIVVYSEQFYADKTSLTMKELEIDISLREKFSEYKEFFNSMERRNKFDKFEESIDTPEKLELGILGAVCNSKTIEFEEVLKIVLMESLNEQDNKYYTAFEKYNIEKVFWNYAKIKYGYDKANKTLKKLLVHIISTVLGSYINEDKLSRISEFIGKNKPNCVVFIDHWMNHKADYIKYDLLSEEYEKEINAVQLIEKLDIEDYKNIDILKIFDRAIIRNIVDSLENKSEDYDKFIELIRGRRTKHFYEQYEGVYEALLNVVEMHKFYKKYNMGIPQKNNEKLFKDYVTEYYKMDTYYRKVYYFYDLQPESNVINRLKSLAENLYVNWYLSEIGTNWSSAINEDMKKDWRIPGIVNQREFYSTYVNPLLSNGDRVFVIISDALRYEVGAEIAERLNEQVINSTSIYSMLSTVPSITKLGMASLLPHDSISIKDDGRVFVDGNDSSGVQNRSKILIKSFDNSIAVDYQKLPKNKIEFMDSLKGYKLVYIYHDTIDATSDKGSTEIYTVEAVQKAVDEILDLIHKITDWLGGINVLVTADHGFIYQRSDLEESDKIGKEAVEVIDKNRRSFITKENREIDNLLKIDMKYLLNENDVFAYMPKSNIRFKVQGEGSKFVHGGATLQELVVPVVSFKNIRSSYKNSIKAEKVKVKLTNEVRKITNSIFKLNFFQTEKINKKITSSTLEVYMMDTEKNIVSNIETMIADSNNDRPEERVFKIKLTLKAMNYDRNKKYYLTIKDKETGIVLEEIPFVINLGIASDFDF
ncbi:BREX-1 system phosphatase PglZ type A [Clostridium sp. CS001]|uniref:BREX-1 system phosphatase PglZ type A n=1 Tax=Clostridium sp. CS001 TaxID=2880648 RepID=UPI001CF5F9C1|nr:BREX-1 system phosphatase PglZ type A [Clostridium sp. CS001]MCB2290860.1 BREX-1 system phosphatase PglZ type A [Clostridium sp. CS001]